MADDERGQQPASTTVEAQPAQTSPFPGFYGAYLHGIDAKGRLIIPAAFREGLGAGYTVGLTPDMKAIALYPAEEWQRHLNRLRKLLEKDIRVQRYIDRFSKYSYPSCESDAQGRLLLPQRLRSLMLGDSREVEVSGAMDYVRVLDGEAAAREDAEFTSDYPDALELLSGVMQE